MMLQQCDFVNVNCLFRKHLEPLLLENDGSSRKSIITERDIKTISLILQKFIDVSVNRNDIGIFLDNIVKYFWVILKYSRQFNDNESYKHYFVVRMALDVFLFVMDNIKIYSDIASKFVKIIDKIVVDFNRYSCVKEFFRMYSVFLAKVPRMLGTKHKTLHVLYELARSTSDIETQAVILEVILRLFDFNIGRVMEYIVFPEISDLPNIQRNNLYETIRMILDVLNKDSSRIFSINCTKITLDKKTITEFDGAKSTHDIWLDINIPQKILSFFCSKKLITAFTNTKFNTFTSWGVLSFRADDALKTEFVFNSKSKSLEITIKIKSSDFNLFGDFKFDIVRQLVIIVPKYSDDYSKFVTSILPEIFTEFRETQLFKTNESQERSNDSTPDNLSVATTSSSPVISMLRDIKRKKLSTLSERTEVSEEDVINLITDDEEEITESNNKINKEDNTGLQEISHTDSNENLRRSSISESLSLEISRTDSQRLKISMPDPEREALLEKSITPISFTDSVLGKAKRKISAPIGKDDTELNKRKSKKISTLAEKNDINEGKFLKISTSCQTVKFLNEADEAKKVPEPTKLVSYEDDMDYSSSRIEDWLKTVSQQNIVEDQENVPPGTIPPNQTPSVIEDVEGVEKWMERHKESPRLLKNQLTGPLALSSSGKTESLLELLSKDIDNVETRKDTCTLQSEQVNVNKEVAEIGNTVQGARNFNKVTLEAISSDSDVPVSKLVKKWEAAKKTAGGTPQPSADVTTVTGMVPSPKENLEMSVAEEKSQRSVNSTRVPEETIFVDVVREALESVDLVSHFPEPVTANVTVVEFGSVSSDSPFAVREIKRKKAADITEDKKEESQEKICLTEAQIRDENHNISATKRKRTLYNPGDYSYLSETIPEDYILSQTATDSTNHVVKRPRGRPKKSQTQDVKKTLPKVKRRKSKRNKSPTKKTSCCPSKSLEPLKTSLTLDKAFDNLKKKIKDEKKKGKMQKKIEQARKGKRNGALVEVSSPSSPSSLEPFGKSVNKGKKASEEVDVLHNSKRQKQGKTTDKKVNVISNIIVKRAATVERRSSVESPVKNSGEYKRCFCKAYIKQLKNHVRDLFIHIQHCDCLDASEKEMVREIANIWEKS